MLRILASRSDGTIVRDVALKDLKNTEIEWYWIDFNAPSEEEAALLSSHFGFHPLAVEDCLYLMQRPKLDHYDDVHFFVLHALNPHSLDAEEVDLFLGRNYIVTFHHQPLPEIDEAWEHIQNHGRGVEQGHVFAMHAVIDKLVDDYFPSVQQLEDQLADLEANEQKKSTQKLMDEVFEIRSKLLRLRKTVIPMRDLLYRLLNSDKMQDTKVHTAYFADIYDHLLKLSETIEANREITADLRDSFVSINANRMNSIMKTLTVITTIFMPLTFIAGVYGMNFDYMPELQWDWGYFAILAVMFTIGFGMYSWFRNKGWFD